MARGLILAAPASGSGKTVVTLALLRHLSDAGLAVSSLKIGPDYIDPAFHAAASGRCCRNFDPWTMRPATLAAVRRAAEEAAEIVLAEGVMGLFDGASDGTGSSAEVARLTGVSVRTVQRISKEPDIASYDDAAERRRRKIGRHVAPTTG